MSMYALLKAYTSSSWHNISWVQIAAKHECALFAKLANFCLWHGRLVGERLTFAVFVCAALMFQSFRGLDRNTLTINVKGLQKGGVLYIGVFSRENKFGDMDSNVARQALEIKLEKEISVSFPNLANNEYAVAIFQDINQNGKLDKNLLGYPTEPFGFSKNIKPKFSSPSFNDCKFHFRQSESITINILN